VFHYPIHVFKGWDTSGPGTKNYQELGPVLFFIKSFFVNSLFGVIIPQIIFIYVLIYWLLPNYYFKKRKLLTTASVTTAVLLIVYFIAIGFKHSPLIYNYFAHAMPIVSDFDFMRRIVLIDQATTLPIIAGIALMIKLVKRWWLKNKETEQLAKEKIKAELQLLKAQVHPHFLFNTLNNIYFFTMSGSPKAPEMIKKLSGLLKYILHECNQPFVTLDKEIKMIQDYMELEKIRYGEHMQMSVEFPADCKNKMIAPLLLIPFVENSFKHGTSKVLTRPYVNLYIEVKNNSLHFSIINSRPDANGIISAKGNIGLKNVRKRLELLYPKDHELVITPGPGTFLVDLKVQLQNAIFSAEKEAESISTTTYAIG
jgi:two-component system LytT family sensor kinase